ncbi:cysteine proteinase 15A [Pelomyxa schiedti]|nr:cysteine proteinase 15A [Pelomyxa schiedti]
MKVSLFVSVALVAAVVEATELWDSTKMPEDTPFEGFETMYNKHYGSEGEREYRKAVFTLNMVKAKEWNDRDGRKTYGASPFADMTAEEFRSSRLMAPADAESLARACMEAGVYQPTPAPVSVQIDDSFDWRDTPGVVQSVKDQASCGSCWAFSTVEAMEGAYGIAGKSVELSAQFVTDCSRGCSSEIYEGANTTVCNKECSGGWPWTALNDIATQAIGGVPLWSEYPYTGAYEQCRDGNYSYSFRANITSYTCPNLDKGTKDEDVMADSLKQYGPLSIAVNAEHFQLYIRGIMDPVFCDTTYLDHAVLLVGWGIDKDPLFLSDDPYWIVKNSWGSTWGEDGYLRMARGNGCCGINQAVTAAIL